MVTVPHDHANLKKRHRFMSTNTMFTIYCLQLALVERLDLKLNSQ